MTNRQDPETFQRVISASPPEIANLALAARKLVLDVMPGAYEIVWPRQKTAGYGTGPRKMTEHFAWIAPFTGHVVFGFYYGAELADPHGLLEGTGKRLRHVKVRSLADLERRGVRELIEEASRHAVPPLRDDADAARHLERARKAALSGTDS